MNERWTNNERTMNKRWMTNERTMNEQWTNDEKTMNKRWMTNERTMNEQWTINEWLTNDEITIENKEESVHLYSLVLSNTISNISNQNYTGLPTKDETSETTYRIYTVSFHIFVILCNRKYGSFFSSSLNKPLEDWF